MPFVVFVMLAALCETEGDLTMPELVAATDYVVHSLNNCMVACENRGWVARKRGLPSRVRVTERGRIALAIMRGRVTRARAAGRQPPFEVMTRGWFREKRL